MYTSTIVYKYIGGGVVYKRGTGDRRQLAGRARYIDILSSARKEIKGWSIHVVYVVGLSGYTINNT